MRPTWTLVIAALVAASCDDLRTASDNFGVNFSDFARLPGSPPFLVLEGTRLCEEETRCGPCEEEPAICEGVERSVAGLLECIPRRPSATRSGVLEASYGELRATLAVQWKGYTGDDGLSAGPCDEGCGCRGGAPGGWADLGLGLLALALRRRRPRLRAPDIHIRDAHASAPPVTREATLR